MGDTTEKRVQISISEQIEQTEYPQKNESSGQAEYIKQAGEAESYEQAVTELEEIVNRLERGELTLDESIQFFQRGVELTKYCSKRLDEAERSITMLIEGEDGIIEKEMTV